jgi:predicted DNA-binding transcriptional regulator AlpA
MGQAMKQPEAGVFLRVRDVSAITGISVRDVWRKSSADEHFPKPRKLSPRRTAWVREEVEAWCATLIEGRR